MKVEATLLLTAGEYLQLVNLKRRRTEPSPRSPASVQTLLVRRLVELDLLDQASAQSLIFSGIGLPGSTGESLVVSSCLS